MYISAAVLSSLLAAAFLAPQAGLASGSGHASVVSLSVDEHGAVGTADVRVATAAAASAVGTSTEDGRVTRKAVPRRQNIRREQPQGDHQSSALEQPASSVTASSLVEASRSVSVPDPNYLPHNIRSTDGICSQLETDMDESYDGTVRGFDRHQPFCNRDAVLKKWKLSRAGTLARYRIDYTCCQSKYLQDCKRNMTEWTDEGSSGATEAYFAHKLQCYEIANDPAYGHRVMVQRGFHQQTLVTPQKEASQKRTAKIRFEYWCCEIAPFGDCIEKETLPQPGTTIINFERHELVCEENYAIAEWQLLAFGSEQHFKYRCCPYQPLNATLLPPRRKPQAPATAAKLLEE